MKGMAGERGVFVGANFPSSGTEVFAYWRTTFTEKCELWAKPGILWKIRTYKIDREGEGS